MALSVAGHVMVHFLGVDVAAGDVDPLSGLLNRRAFHRRTGQLLSSPGTRRGTQLCVTMIDLDHFKRLNDSRGHRFGDSALIAVSKLINEMTDENAVVARVGGEEFLVAEINELAETNRRAESLCEAIAASDFGITASIGIACAAVPGDGTDDRAVIDELIEAADTAMYDAKRAGGGRVGLQHDAPLRRVE